MNEARDAGARRRRASDSRVDARFAWTKPDSYGETPAYLLRRKSTLLREMNEDMERALREIEHRRLERELEREHARAASHPQTGRAFFPELDLVIGEIDEERGGAAASATTMTGTTHRRFFLRVSLVI